MNSQTIQSVKNLGKFKKPTIFDKGVAALLPEAYKKFYREWRLTPPTAVHYIPEEGNWKRDEVTGEVHPVQNVPIPLKYPVEFNNHIWGGEGVVQGFYKKHKYKRRVPHFWFPLLRRSVVYSEVLDKHFSVIVTDRAIKLINGNYGFDHYLLKTPACDLKSLLPLNLKRMILQDLEKGCPAYADRPEQQKDVLERFKNYLSVYTPEEIKWYGYSLSEACSILLKQLNDEKEREIIPLKHVYRSQLIEKLKTVSLNEKSDNLSSLGEADSASWLQKINPFGKKHET